MSALKSLAVPHLSATCQGLGLETPFQFRPPSSVPWGSALCSHAHTFGILPATQSYSILTSLG